MAKSKNYQDLLIESLKDSNEAISYLNAVLEECGDDSEESKMHLLMALKNVAEAQGGISKLSEF